MNFIYKLITTLILIFSIHFAVIANEKSSTPINIKNADTDVIKIVEKLKNKKKLIKTARLESKVTYNLPFRKKLKLVQVYSIKKESNIHVDIFAIWKIKVAEFFTEDKRVIYKRLGKKDRIRNIGDFNLRIFNKYLDLPLTPLELNNFLLGMNLDSFNENYMYISNGKKLLLFNKTHKCIIDLKTNEIEKVFINDKRGIEITYSKYSPVENEDINLPLYVELKTKTFSMQINFQNDIIINKEI